jgi:hypothetical protein
MRKRDQIRIRVRFSGVERDHRRERPGRAALEGGNHDGGRGRELGRRIPQQSLDSHYIVSGGGRCRVEDHAIVQITGHRSREAVEATKGLEKVAGAATTQG